MWAWRLQGVVCAREAFSGAHCHASGTLSLPFHALVHKLACNSRLCISVRLVLPCLVAQLMRPELDLGNDVRILTRDDNHSFCVEHVRDQHPGTHVSSPSALA